MGSRLESGSQAVRKRIENHVFTGEDGEEYNASKFGGFGDYFRRKKIKLQNLDAEIRSSSPNKPQIFRGIVAHVNGYTQPSLNDLHRLIVSHGGGFLQYLDGKTAATHMIASALTPKKREEFRKYRVVRPEWVVESIRAGRLLPWQSFRLIDEGRSQKLLKFGDGGPARSENNNQTYGYRSQTDSSWYTSQIKGDRSTSDGLAETRDVNPDGLATSNVAETSSDLIQTPTADTGVDELPLTPNNFPIQLGNVLKTPTPDRGPSPIKRKYGSPAESVEKQGCDGKAMTSEDHNAALLSNPRMQNSSVVNPDFIQQYYRESRLHHLSTWKADLKSQLQRITDEKASHRNSTKRRIPGSRRYIIHVDFDSFFAAVSLQKHPELTDKPVAIAHGPGPGSEIASCNYPARTFGIKNGMWMKGALQLCPDLKVLPYDFTAYEDASRKFYESILEIDGVVQSVSIDEALVDISSLCIDAGGSDGKSVSEGSIWQEQSMADDISQTLRDCIKQKTGCNVSVGIGGNILQAKLALKKAKPAGQFQVKPEAILEFIGDFTVQDLPGVAYSLGSKLEELGVKYVKDIRQLTKERLTSHLGPKTGSKLWDYSRGIDNTEVGEQVIRKSVSAEINWGIRFIDQTQAEEFVQNLCEELHRRLIENGVKGKQLTMRIMRRSADSPLDPPKHLGHGKCDTFNKSIILGRSTNSSDVIGKEAISILRAFNFSPGDLRGLGVQMTKLEPIKTNSKGEPENSQRQLEFKPSSPVQRNIEPLDPDEVRTPKKGDMSSQYIPESFKTGRFLNDASQKPLNVTGTQFIMPSQVNPTVLAELPQDIRSKFVTKDKPSIGERLRAAATNSQTRSPFASSSLPPQSQLDQETLDALPGDVRNEVLSYYNPKSPQLGYPSQKISSPARAKKITTPTKSRTIRGRGRPPSRSTKPNTNSTLTQSNFIVARPSSSTSLPKEEEPEVSELQSVTEPVDDISPEFLAALPEDIRQEVVEQQKRSRLQKHGGLNLPFSHSKINNKKRSFKPPERPPGQKLLHLDPRPAKPTFTSKKLSSLPELREAVSEWYSSFETEGPYEEDVTALTKYLRRVILEEKDISKAVDLARWLSWLINDGHNQIVDDDKDNGDNSKAGEVKAHRSLKEQSLSTWKQAVRKVQGDVSDAVMERGLPPVEFP